MEQTETVPIVTKLNRNDTKFLQLIENTDNPITIDMIIEGCNVSRTTAWRLRKRLSEHIAPIAERVAKTKAVDMIRYLDKNASNGDTGAAVKILEIGGVYVPKQIGGAQGTVNLGIIVLPTREVLPGEPVEVEVIESKP